MKFSIHTMGCKVNQAESAAMAAALKAAGLEPCGSGEPGLVVLNTCAVTLVAEKEARRILRRLRREFPGARVVAAGCLAQMAPDRLLEGSLADLALGNSWKGSLTALLEAPSGTALADGGPGGPFPEAPRGEPPAAFSGRTRAFHKIQDGCPRRCAYCVIPAVRGASRSLPLSRALADLTAAMEAGAAEAVLTGIHLGAWGADLGGGESLASLLDAVARDLRPDPGRFRLRLSSLEPGEAMALLPAFRKHAFLAPHLHLPLQAGSDRVLRAMCRPYTAAEYRAAAEAFAGELPGVSIGSDLIAGFPGETEEDFEEGMGAVRSLPLSYLHVFPFSERPGTPAAGLPGQVPPRERRRRAALLKGLDREIRARFLEKSFALEHLALAEGGLHRDTGRRRALTGNYLHALLPEGSDALPGRLLKVRLSPSRNLWGIPEAEPLP
ncbi:MAG: MiaB/RimO family radical SAM methylthiotransferase [Deltaproteobacteria bacterium]|jgi:threonylcarbamoyladenosine tRNA methylthiotransferase MtaB|nr:MiaB/RimO family radical SAM methylthiotransferase [Deltaproteobacteria bacterium]